MSQLTTAQGRIAHTLTATRYLVPVLFLFSFFVLIAGCEPSGSFVGRLIATSAFACAIRVAWGRGNCGFHSDADRRGAIAFARAGGVDGRPFRRDRTRLLMWERSHAGHFRHRCVLTVLWRFRSYLG